MGSFATLPAFSNLQLADQTELTLRFDFIGPTEIAAISESQLERITLVGCRTFRSLFSHLPPTLRELEIRDGRVVDDDHDDSPGLMKGSDFAEIARTCDALERLRVSGHWVTGRPADIRALFAGEGDEERNVVVELIAGID